MARIYLAYGCNLNLEVIAERCPSAQALCPVLIRGWRLAFAGDRLSRWGPGGVATLLEDSASGTRGALYVLSVEDEAAMDDYEGVPEGIYYKDDSFAGMLEGYSGGRKDVVFTYLMSRPVPLNPPPVRYIRAICQGYRDWGFPGHPLVNDGQ